MAKTRGGKVVSRRSRRMQGLKASPAITTTVRRSRRGRTMAGEDDEVEDVTPQVLTDDVVIEDAEADEDEADKTLSAVEDEVAKKQESREKEFSKEHESRDEVPDVEAPEKETEDGESAGQDHNDNEGEAFTMEEDGVTDTITAEVVKVKRKRGRSKKRKVAEKGADDGELDGGELNRNEEEGLAEGEDGVTHNDTAEVVKKKKKRGNKKKSKAGEKGNLETEVSKEQDSLPEVTEMEVSEKEAVDGDSGGQKRNGNEKEGLAEGEDGVTNTDSVEVVKEKKKRGIRKKSKLAEKGNREIEGSKEQECRLEVNEMEVSEKEAVDGELDGGEHNGNEEEGLGRGDDGVTNNISAEVAIDKKKRGPTKMRKVAENPEEKVEVTFTDFGDHVGPGSVTLSSFLGPLVREHVPVTLTDWRKLDEVTKDTMWEEIQGRFNVEEQWQKDVIMKQLGNLWRAGKSRLVTDVRDAKNAAERAALKPSNITSIQVWNAWVRSKTSASFKVVSEKYRELRKNHIPHTTSRKGMLRLAYDLKNKSDDPSQVSRSKIWIAGHTHADGRPVKPQFAETIEQIQSLDSQMDSTSAADNIREDAVSKILGKDKRGRVRGFGRGITATKLAFLQSRDAKIANMQSEITQLKGLVENLAGKKKRNGDPETTLNSAYLKEGVRVQILDWFDSGDVVIGEGEFCSAEAVYKIGRIPIGPNAVAIIVKSALNPEASLWRPTVDVSSLEEAVGCKIAWPLDKVILDTPPNSFADVSQETTVNDARRCRIYDWTNEDEEVIAEGIMHSANSKGMVNNIPLGPNAVSIEVVKAYNNDAPLWRPTADMVLIGDAINEYIAWPVLKVDLMIENVDATPTKPPQTKVMSPGSTSTTRSENSKCILLECNNSGRKVAEGRVMSRDPKAVCHFVPLGPNASKVWLEVAKIGNARLWRPNSEFTFISDAIGSAVAWPNDKIVFI